jgi:hypothetical protein
MLHRSSLPDLAIRQRNRAGKTKTEIMRCLKRYIAREAFVLLTGKRTAVR